MLAATPPYDHPLVKAVLALHILAAVVWVGGGLVLTMFNLVERSQDDETFTLAYLRRAGRLRTWCFLPASCVLLACGFGLVGLLDVSLRALWIDLALGGWFICLGLSTGFLVPRAEALLHGPPGDLAVAEFARLLRGFRHVASVESLVLVLVVIDMVARP